MDNNSNIAKFIKKNRIFLVSALAFTVALCSIFAFAGNKTGDSESLDYQSEAVNSVAELSETSELTELQGVGIYLDGYFLAAVSDSSVAESALDTVLNERIDALNLKTDAENSFVNSVELVSGKYPAGAFLEESSVSALLGDTVKDYSGEILPVKLSVSSVSTYSENVVIEYDTVTLYTDTLLDGVTKVTSEGYNGEGIETYRVTAVNGVEIDREVISLEVSTAPVDEEITVGVANGGKEVASLSSFDMFIKPCDGVITSGVGIRWGRMHKGIDIFYSGCYGDPVVAVADGVVTLATDNGNGYGKHVTIDHGDGITTLSAHFSKLNVKAGQEVKQGDVIGYIGNTGYSYGAHLHFEIKIDGVIQDPLLFFEYEDQ